MHLQAGKKAGENMFAQHSKTMLIFFSALFELEQGQISRPAFHPNLLHPSSEKGIVSPTGRLGRVSSCGRGMRAVRLN
jgi:hypothetical protein